MNPPPPFFDSGWVGVPLGVAKLGSANSLQGEEGACVFTLTTVYGYATYPTYPTAFMYCAAAVAAVAAAVAAATTLTASVTMTSSSTSSIGSCPPSPVQPLPLHRPQKLTPVVPQHREAHHLHRQSGKHGDQGQRGGPQQRR